MILDIIGWLGSICFAICALPQAYSSWKHKNSDGISWGFLILWLVGEVLTLTYILLTTAQLPLIANYCLNFVFLVVIIWFKVYPRPLR
jgi:uncharacterized protein with PQ loop repeat